MGKLQQVLQNNKLVLLMILILLVNTVLAGLAYNIVSRQYLTQNEELNYHKRFAKDLWEYNNDFAKELGVEDRGAVRDSLSRFIQAIEVSTTKNDLNEAVLTNARRAQETIIREYEGNKKERILSIVNRDPQVRKIEDNQKVIITLCQGEGIVVEPQGFFVDETIEAIAEEFFEGELEQEITIDIDIENGVGNLSVPFNPLDHIKALSTEIDTLRLRLRETRIDAGLAEMSGDGLIINIYDADEGYSTEAIMHETDIRDVINELYAAGAKGVAVGNQRLIATSAIRCVGPVIMVNDERISVNPVVITAIGDPNILESGMDIIRLTLENTRGLHFNVERAENLILPAYSR